MAWEHYKKLTSKDLQTASQRYERESSYGKTIGRGYMQGHLPFALPNEGQNCYRILPPPELSTIRYYGLNVFFHRNILPTKDICVCLASMAALPDIREVWKPMVEKFGSKCPICMMQTSDLWDTNPELAKTYFPEMKVLMWVLDLMLPEDHENYMTPLIFACAKTVAKEIVLRSSKPGTNIYIDVADPIEGVPVWFNREGKGMATKYTGVTLGDEPWPLSEEFDGAIPSLVSAVDVMTFDEIRQALSLDVGNGEGYVVNIPETEQEEVEKPACFGKEFGTYQDCEGECDFIEECEIACNETKQVQKPVAPKKPSAPSMPKKRVPLSPPSGATMQQSTTAEDMKARIREKIAKMRRDQQ